MMQQRLVGGSVRAIKQVRLFNTASKAEIKKALLPAFVLMDAQSDLIEITQALQASNPAATALDGFMEVATLHHEPVDTKIDKSGWKTRSVKTGRGWLVPMPVGYQAIGPKFEPGELEHCRNPEYPSQYVEAIYGLGKWVFPFRLPPEFSDCFWRYRQSDNLFLVSQTNISSQGDQS
jgi:CRISPR-associated protein Csy2